SLAFKAAYLELVPRFEQESGLEVATTFVGGAEIAKRLRAGEQTDLVIMAARGIDDLIAEGLLAKGSRVDLVRSKIGVAVKAGAPRPDISSEAALRRALDAAKSIAYSSGPSGVYLAEVFKRWELPPAKLHQSAPGMPAGDFVASGECEIGFQQVSELLPVDGIDYVGPLPESLQLVTVFSAATSANAPNAQAAKALTRYFTSMGVAPVLAKHGLDPA
ncbi:MAG TPA: substrate-binding domain-containing protein, partial [Usitatibacter sp.]|nr:substrate-binding domain-containing protein [Usitatibacter sp.]